MNIIYNKSFRLRIYDMLKAIIDERFSKHNTCSLFILFRLTYKRFSIKISN